MRAHPFPQTARAPNFLMRWRTIIGSSVCVLSRKAFEGQMLRRRGGGGFVPHKKSETIYSNTRAT